MDRRNLSVQRRKIVINCSKEYLELVRNATLFDDPYMDVFFKDQPQLAQFVLRLILDKPDLVVESVRIQDTIPDLGSKTVRMDITATDSTGKLYDIEFQTVLGSNLKERGRFYQSKIDNDVLRKGDDYTRLPELYIIFICRGDVPGNGKPLDHFCTRNEEGIALGDGRHLIFINADHESDWRLKELMEDFKCPDPQKMRYNEIKERSIYLKVKEEGAMSMTPAMEKYSAYLRQEGKTEGILDLIRNALKKGKSPEAISDFTDWPVDEIKKIEQEMNTKPE